MEKLPIAMQVYSLRENAEKDFSHTMRCIREMGYDGVELAGLYGLAPEEIRKCLDENKLKAISAHVSYEQLIENMESVIQDYKIIGCEYIAIPYLGESRRFDGEDYKETLAGIRKISAACKAEGITLLYHNHDFEFAKTENGVYAIDELYGAFQAAELGAEFDTCWIRAAGENPVEYLKKYKGRCPVVHIKDFIKNEKVELVALGDGVQDIAAIAAMAVEAGAKWLVIEQDDHPYQTPMNNMRESLSYLKKEMGN